jgi:hypothetical protein
VGRPISLSPASAEIRELNRLKVDQLWNASTKLATFTVRDIPVPWFWIEIVRCTHTTS